MTMKNLMAQGRPIGNIIEGLGKLGKPGNSAGGIFNSVISLIIGVVTVIAGLIFFFIVLTGAISIITAGEDKQALETARKKIFVGFAGMILLVAAIFIVDIIGNLLGLELLDPTSILDKIWTGLVP